MPQQTRVDGRNLRSEPVQSSTTGNHKLLQSGRKSSRNSRRQVRRLHRYLLFQSWISCAAALAGAAQKLGLDQKTALTAAAHALADGIVSWREGDISSNYLLREAATPGGI